MTPAAVCRRLGARGARPRRQQPGWIRRHSHRHEDAGAGSLVCRAGGRAFRCARVPRGGARRRCERRRRAQGHGSGRRDWCSTRWTTRCGHSARSPRRTGGALPGPVIGITGQNGKTSTKEMVAAVLSTRWQTHKTRANLNNLVGVPMTILEAPADGGGAGGRGRRQPAGRDCAVPRHHPARYRPGA